MLSWTIKGEVRKALGTVHERLATVLAQGDLTGSKMHMTARLKKVQGVNFTKEIPFNKFSENIKILLKLDNN